MSTHPPRTVPEDPAACATLGDLLYRDTPKQRIPESAWVAQVRAIATQDAKALRTLFDIAHPLVSCVARRITQDGETAEEVTSEVFYEIWLRAADFDPAQGPVIGWIMNLARARAIDRVQRHTPEYPQPNNVQNRRSVANTAEQHIDGEDRL